MDDILAGQLKAKAKAKSGAGHAANCEIGRMHLKEADMRQVPRQRSRIDVDPARRKAIAAQGLPIIQNEAAGLGPGRRVEELVRTRFHRIGFLPQELAKYRITLPIFMRASCDAP